MYSTTGLTSWSYINSIKSVVCPWYYHVFSGPSPPEIRVHMYTINKAWGSGRCFEKPFTGGSPFYSKQLNSCCLYKETVVCCICESLVNFHTHWWLHLALWCVNYPILLWILQCSVFNIRSSQCVWCLYCWELIPPHCSHHGNCTLELCNS